MKQTIRIGLFLCGLFFQRHFYAAEEQFNWLTLPDELKDKIMHYCPVPENSRIMSMLGSSMPLGSDDISQEYASVGAIAYDKSGNWIARASGKKIYIYHTHSHQLHLILSGQFSKINDIAFSLDGSNILVAANNGVFIHDIAGNVTVRQLLQGREAVHLMHVSGGARIAAGCSNGRIYFWNARTNQSRGSLPDGRKSIQCLASAQNVLVASSEKVVSVWDLNYGAKWHTISCPNKVCSLSINQQGSQVAIGADNGEIVLYSITSEEYKRFRKLKGHTKPISGLEYSKKNTLVSGSKDATIRIWNVITGKCLNETKSAGPVTKIAINPRFNRTLVVTNTSRIRTKVVQFTGSFLRSIIRWFEQGCRLNRDSFTFFDSDTKAYVKRLDPLKLRLYVFEIFSALGREKKQRDHKLQLLTCEQYAYLRKMPTYIQRALGFDEKKEIQWTLSKFHLPYDEIEEDPKAAEIFQYHSDGKNEESDSESE